MRKKHTDYNLKNKKDRLNYLKNINTRIKDYADTFGTDSQVYKNQVVKIKTLFPGRSDIFRERDDGIFQLKTGKDFIETEKYFEGINKHKYLDKPTTTEYLKTTLDKMIERGEIPEEITMDTELQGPPTIDKKGKLNFPSIKNIIISYAKEYSELAADIKEDIGFLYGYEDDSEISQAISTLRMSGRRKTYEELEEIKKAIEKAKDLGGYDENDPYKDF